MYIASDYFSIYPQRPLAGFRVGIRFQTFARGGFRPYDTSVYNGGSIGRVRSEPRRA